ncbi:AAA family ATPase [Helicobacter typhlonius]|uniref:AAA family ATPase n=1 Tax=Helicobacter typhlonius TaxID=76936 RepID=UPI002FE3DC8A
MTKCNLNQVREELEVFLDMQNVSQAALARALGISAASISTFRKSEYKGNNEELGRKIKLYLDDYANKNKANAKKEKVQVYESYDKQMADFVINEAIADKEIAIITGVAGSGKSTIAKEYALTHPNAILIEATLHTSARVLLDELSERLHLTGGRNLHEKVLLIAKELKRRDVVILIDEAEHLSVRALEDLRRIWDFSGVPLVLFGTEILLKNLMGKNGELRQLYSRIGGKWNMKGLAREECERLFAQGIYPYTKGNFRSSSKLYRRACRLAQLHNVQLDKDIIAQACAMIIL